MRVLTTTETEKMCNTWESYVFDDVDGVDDRVGPRRRLDNRILQEPPFFTTHQISLSVVCNIRPRIDWEPIPSGPMKSQAMKI